MISIVMLLCAASFLLVGEHEAKFNFEMIGEKPLSFTDEPVMWGTNNVDIGDVGLKFYGEENADHTGHRVAGIGDVNGDGIDDFAIGAYSNDENYKNSGQVYVFFGRSGGFPASTNASSANASFQGVGEDDRAGIDIAGVGDVDNDGYDDFVIGADEYEALGTSGRGRAYLILGKSSGWSMDTSLSSADASWYGEVNEDMFGRAVGGGGDVNGDGYDDIVVGAHDNEEGGDIQGQTYIIFGRSGGWSTNQNIGSTANASFIGVENKEQSGYSVDIVGDTNGDGYDDILIGARYFAHTPGGSRIGHAYLIMGKSSGWSRDTLISSSNATFVGQRSLAGSHVSKAGDVNGDGLADFLITEHMNSEHKSQMGQTYLILGNRSGWSNGTKLSDIDASFWGENFNDESGNSAEGGGDINGDGYDDLIIGAYRNQDGGKEFPYYAGKIYVVYGREKGWRNDTKLSESDASFIGEDKGGALGYCVANAGDVNNDGYDDILAGAWMANFNGNNNGVAYLLNRTSSASISNLTASYNKTNKNINITWTNDLEDPFQYGIYRGINGSSLERIDNTTDAFYVDDNVTLGMICNYTVVRFCPLGEESDKVTPVKILVGEDFDGDGIEDSIDDDDDNDNVTDDKDAFPRDSTEWEDTDGDGTGNNADTDDDGDNVSDEDDEFPLDPDEWEDTDKDGTGNNADDDDDGDNVTDDEDDFPLDPTEWLDTDMDGTGNNADTDDDGDGFNDMVDVFPLNPLEWLDTDSDGTGDNADTDDDGDDVADEEDDFPLDPTEWLDTDMDGTGNNADDDDDGDGYLDVDDAFPLDPLDWIDTDLDGIGDNSDDDDDGDGVIDSEDQFPLDPTEWNDTDEDGTGDNTDLDDDGDGVPDEFDLFPYDPVEWNDTDEDGTGDNTDLDDDGDGVLDEFDLFPYDPVEWNDTDEDGTGDNTDLDDDGDGVPDLDDVFPYDPIEWEDTDEDGTGNNADDDDDGDGVIDNEDLYPLDPTRWEDPAVDDDDDTPTDDDDDAPTDDDDTPSDDDDQPADDDTDEEEDSDSGSGDGVMIYIVIIGIVLLVVIMMIIFFMARKNKEDEEE